MLRHPVVITSLEEDFEKIGLIKKPLTEMHSMGAKEYPYQGMDHMDYPMGSKMDYPKGSKKKYPKGSKMDYPMGSMEYPMGSKDLPMSQGGETGTGDPGSNTHGEGGPEDMRMGYKVGGDRLTGKHHPPKSRGIDQMEREDDDDWDPLDEAIAFSESFDEEWESLGPVRELSLDEDDMDEMDGMAEESVELPGGVLYGIEEDDEDFDEDFDEDSGKMEDIAASMARIESIVESMQAENSTAASIPAFANVALIAEQLAVFFDAIAEDDQEFQEAAGHYAEMAQEAAGIVEVLRTEDEDEIDFDTVRSDFSAKMESLLNGLEVYSDLTEDEAYEGNA